MRRSILLLVPSLLILALFLTAPGGPKPSVEFTHGVASGDVTHNSAVLWTRVDQKAKLTIEVSTNPAFPKKGTLKETVSATADNDFTAKVVVAPLKKDDTYFYRFRSGKSVSEVGTFRTPDLPTKEMDVRFAYSGDSDGFGIPFPFGDFGVLNAIGNEAPDFWVYLGDTIYSDSGLRLGGPATILDEYRDAYKLNREVDAGALQDLMAAISTYAIWDDHEVLNDYDGQTVDPTRFANGREAFLEYMPILDQGLLQDPACADDPLFRVFPWGEDTDIIILDGRSCRSADAAPACIVAALGQPDLAPTLPTSLREEFGPLLPFPLNLLLQEEPPAGCLDAINDASRTMGDLNRTILGAVQKAAFKDALLNSDAKFKFVMNGPPIQQFYALPYDRWEGYGAERAEILNFINDNSIDNVVFLSTDMHANLINGVSTDILNPFAPVVAQEFVTGPIATNTFETEVRALLGEIGVFAFNSILTIVGADCRDLDVDSYGLIEVDAAAGTATISLRDDQGDPVMDKGPDAIGPCTKTIGP